MDQQHRQMRSSAGYRDLAHKQADARIAGDKEIVTLDVRLRASRARRDESCKSHRRDGLQCETHIYFAG